MEGSTLGWFHRLQVRDGVASLRGPFSRVAQQVNFALGEEQPVPRRPGREDWQRYEQ